MIIHFQHILLFNLTQFWIECHHFPQLYNIWLWLTMTKYIVLGGAATCSEGFVNCFLRVPQALGCTAAAMLPKQARELLDNILQNLPQQVPAPPSISARFGSVTYHFIFWYLQKSLSQAKMTPPAWRYKVRHNYFPRFSSGHCPVRHQSARISADLHDSHMSSQLAPRAWPQAEGCLRSNNKRGR